MFNILFCIKKKNYSWYHILKVLEFYIDLEQISTHEMIIFWIYHMKIIAISINGRCNDTSGAT